MKKVVLLIYTLLFLIIDIYPQINTNVERLNELSKMYYSDFFKKKQNANDYAKANNIPLKIETDSSFAELIFIDETGNPQYFITSNANAAATSSVDEVYSGGAAGLSLDGSGISVVEWDAGNIRTTHQEFDSRATNMDGSSANWHSTHVAGTIIASGVEANAKGMAFAASLKSYDWNYHHSEMATEAADGNLVSNHSYGWKRGWEGATWWGDTLVSTQEDYRFGFYDYSAKAWDEIAVNAPYNLIVKSAGNDRNDNGDGSYPPDGPYDCIDQYGIAKNILTVGAVNDIPAGYSQPSDVVMSSFSSWGPADDGRIKPDIVANGVGLKSSSSSADTTYASYSGTSMSTPTTSGSLALLIQHYENVKGSGIMMRSATLKALVLHTADEAGTNDGPDYSFGWGLLNTQTAAEKISEDTLTDVITEHNLANGESFTRNITTTGTSPIRVTIVWTDPPGITPVVSLDPADTMLINDLDLRITEGANTYYPWKLDKDIPANAATKTAENNIDNIEMIDISSVSNSTTYTITVDHDGTLASPQAFSMIISGDIENAVAPTADFYADNILLAIDQEVSFSDASINIPTAWQWTFDPTTVQYLNGTTSTSQNPEVEFEAIGTYKVSLYVSNANGNDTEIKTDYITVGEAPQNYCSANSENPYGYISRVKIGIIDKNSTYSTNSPYYEDWTTETVGVAISHSHFITITNGSDTAIFDLAIWIDWNRDGDFYDTDESIVCDIDNYGEGTFTIDVPSSAELGSTRMRIRAKFYNDFACAPCGTTDYGEVEDYTIKVHPCITWIGAAGANWNLASNWSTGIVPDSTYGVTIPTGDSLIIQSGTNAACFSLKLEQDATITIYGNMEVGN